MKTPLAELVTLYVASVRPDDLTILIDSFRDSEKRAAKKFAASLTQYESSQRQAQIVRAFAPSGGHHNASHGISISATAAPAAQALATALLRRAAHAMTETKFETNSPK